ncbi:hypothetical protein, partial [Tetragenococcus halophilus]|uniref:hypothetical protein n=1 Tax=Tetragenococcus halophilus TaxID=51669 RepID=UPI00295F2DFB
FDIFVLKHLFSPFILVSNLIIKETNAFLLYKKLVLLLIFLVTTLNIIDPFFIEGLHIMENLL